MCVCVFARATRFIYWICICHFRHGRLMVWRLKRMGCSNVRILQCNAWNTCAVCVCVYACMGVSVYVHVYMRVCTHACMRLCICVGVSVCVWVHLTSHTKALELCFANCLLV